MVGLLVCDGKGLDSVVWIETWAFSFLERKTRGWGGVFEKHLVDERVKS